MPARVDGCARTPRLSLFALPAPARPGSQCGQSRERQCQMRNDAAILIRGHHQRRQPGGSPPGLQCGDFRLQGASRPAGDVAPGDIDARNEPLLHKRCDLVERPIADDEMLPQRPREDRLSLPNAVLPHLEHAMRASRRRCDRADVLPYGHAPDARARRSRRADRPRRPQCVSTAAALWQPRARPALRQLPRHGPAAVAPLRLHRHLLGTPDARIRNRRWHRSGARPSCCRIRIKANRIR
ncbi:hypothetical protein ACVWW1_000431 [Bradyrhizobium sp. JR3.5]